MDEKYSYSRRINDLEDYKHMIVGTESISKLKEFLKLLDDEKKIQKENGETEHNLDGYIIAMVREKFQV